MDELNNSKKSQGVKPNNAPNADFKPEYKEERMLAFEKWLTDLASYAELQAQIKNQKTGLKSFRDRISGFLSDQKKVFADNRAAREKNAWDHSSVSQYENYLNTVSKELSDFAKAYKKCKAEVNPRNSEYGEEFAKYDKDISGTIAREQTAVKKELEGLEFYKIERKREERSLAPEEESFAEERASSPDPNESFIKIDLDDTIQAEVDDRVQPDASLAQQRARILKCAEGLEKAKTTFNSNEYNELIKLMRQVGNGAFKGQAGMSGNEQFAYELSFIDAQIEKYLAHKAKDGVKKNSYAKLSAVEAASRTVSECAKLCGDMELTLNKGTLALPQNVRDINPELSKRMGRLDNSFLSLVMDPKPIYEEAAKKFVHDANLKASELKSVEQHIRDVDNCMCKIIVKAVENDDRAAGFSLKAMRKIFLDDPFPAAAPEKKSEAVKQASNKGATR